MPLSNCPSSLLELMNMEFTDITRPRSSSGVFNCKIVPLTTTLIPSSMPANIRAANESRNHFDNAKMIMQLPNPATAKNNFLPWFFCNGAKVSNTTMKMEPMSEAAFSQPKPSGPTLRISLAYTGTIATAPPNNTANRSRVMAPSTSFVLKTNLNPSFTLSHVRFSEAGNNAF